MPARGVLFLLCSACADTHSSFNQGLLQAGDCLEDKTKEDTIMTVKQGKAIFETATGRRAVPVRQQTKEEWKLQMEFRLGDGAR